MAKLITLENLAEFKEQADNLYATQEYVDSKSPFYETTYSELKALRDDGELIPGAYYRITDYITTTNADNTSSAGHQFDIIVQALDESHLSEDARATYHGLDGYFAETVSAVASASFIEGTTLNDIEERFTMLLDAEKYENDPHELTEIGTTLNADGIEVPYILNPDPDDNGHDVKYLFVGTQTISNYQNTLVKVLYVMNYSDEMVYEGEDTAHKNDVIVDAAVVDGTPRLYKTDVVDYFDEVDTAEWFEYVGDYVLDGVTYNKWEKWEDDVENGYYYLTNVIVVNGTLTVTPEQIRAAVTETSTTYDKWQEYYYKEDVYSDYCILTNQVVEATYVQKVKYNANLSAWKLKYCLDNDQNRFGWANDRYYMGSITVVDTNEATHVYQYPNDFLYPDFTEEGSEAFIFFDENMTEEVDPYNADRVAVGMKLYDGTHEANPVTVTEVNLTLVVGKGVIYEMEDEYGNRCPYDFKNIQFHNSEYSEYPLYTFSYIMGDDTVADASFTEKTNFLCKSNVIETYYITNGKQQSLNKNMFIVNNSGCNNNVLGANCSDNIVFGGSNNNIFGVSCHNNKLAGDDSNNTFGSECSDNTFGDNCESNTFGNNCVGNIFGNNCVGNIFGYLCNSNTFGNFCAKNTFNNGCEHNTFGSYCESNTFGNFCGNNTFGNYCSNNIFASNCSGNVFGDYCSSNTFGSGCVGNGFGINCSSNDFGDNCESNAFGSGCCFITFGSGCCFITFGTSGSTTINYCQYITLENGCGYLNITSTDTSATAANQLQNIHIHEGVRGSDSALKTITIPTRNNSFCTEVRTANDVILEV